jgi:hypothetical protein
MTRTGVKQQMAAIIEPHIPALKHLLASMAIYKQHSEAMMAEEKLTSPALKFSKFIR